MESEPVIKLTYLVGQRRRRVEDRRRFSYRLINTLKQYYSHLLDWFHIETPVYFVISLPVGLTYKN
jgi:hypothetical protein